MSSEAEEIAGRTGFAHGHRPFVLVLAGGGARGYAHAGVLRALEEEGLRPSGIVGVSMGAVVGATYAAREDWFQALMDIDVGRFPQSLRGRGSTQEVRFVRRALGYAHTAWNMVTGWGAPEALVKVGREVLEDLLGDHLLEEGRIPVAVCATDLRSGARVELNSGKAAEAVYASAALAGVLPPARHGHMVLADGAYSDIAPIDVARAMGHPMVLAVDPHQMEGVAHIDNGLQTVMRAVEICHLRHAELRLGQADLVLRPRFPRSIDVLDFGARSTCISAGTRAVVDRLGAIQRLLSPPAA